MRARFEAIHDRLGALEYTLDALERRFSLKTIHERRYEERLLERLIGNSEMLERQALALESIHHLLERLEHRMDRLEQKNRTNATLTDRTDARDGRLPDPRDGRLPDPRDGRFAGYRKEPEAASDDEYADWFAVEETASSEGPVPSPSVAKPITTDIHPVPPLAGSTIHGDLSEMSLATVFAMLELERRSGILRVRSQDGVLLSATLRSGAIVGAKRRDTETDPVDVVRDALRFTAGHFWFRQVHVDAQTGTPRSVGSVLLEASSRNDESVRLG